jgi:hypothetical protein
LAAFRLWRGRFIGFAFCMNSELNTLVWRVARAKRTLCRRPKGRVPRLAELSPLIGGLDLVAAAGLVAPAVGGGGVFVSSGFVGFDVGQVPDWAAGEFGEWLGEVVVSSSVGQC